MIRFCLLIVFNVLVNGHSILRTPTPWRNRESKNAPCGGGQITGTAQAVTTGDLASVWEVTAGDGNGPITVTYVTTDDQATTAGFAAAAGQGQTLTVTMNPIPQRGTGTYPFTMTTPAEGVCRGGANGRQCHIQVKSTSNWYSCASLEQPAVVVPTASPIPAVTRAPTLFPTVTPPARCTNLVGTTGSLCQALEGKPHFEVANIRQELESISTDFAAIRYNPLVFRNPEPQICAQYLSQLFCSLSIPACDTATLNPLPTCKTRCISALYECDIDPFHADAFLSDCNNNLFSATATDVYGACPAESARKVHLKNLLIGNAPDYWAPKVDFRNKIIYKGDKLTWKWKVSTMEGMTESTLYRFPNALAFQNCDESQATPIQGRIEGDYKEYSLDTTQLTANDGFERYYGSIPGCVADNLITPENPSQKIMIKIVETPVGATVVGFNENEDAAEIPLNPPTQSPPGFFGNPGAIGDSSVAKITISSLAIISTFLLAFL